MIFRIRSSNTLIIIYQSIFVIETCCVSKVASDCVIIKVDFCKIKYFLCSERTLLLKSVLLACRHHITLFSKHNRSCIFSKPYKYEEDIL